MADAIELYLDLSKPQGGLFSSLNSLTAPVFGPFYQGSLLTLRIFPVVRNDSTVAAPFFTALSLANLALQVVVGPAAGAEAIKAAQYTWAKQTSPDTDGKSGYFYATLDLNTTEMNALLGASPSVTTQMDFLLQRGTGNFTPVFQTDITIKAVVKDPGGAVSNPTPAPSYLTREECFNLFVMWDNRLRAENAGRGPILVSPDSSHTRELGIGNDGAPTDNLT